MSYDPYSSYPDEPRPGEPYGEPILQPPGDRERIKGRVQAPAIALIVVAILNLLTMLLQVGGTIRGALQSPKDMENDQQMVMKIFPKEIREAMEQQQQNQTPQEEKIRALIVNVILSLLMMLGAILSLLGGIRMLSMRSYGLCIAGAISAAIPCISCSGCCGFGEIIGIWAIVVLLNPDVKAMFQ